MPKQSVNGGVKIFTFKVAFIGRRGVWRRIEIRSDQDLADLDRAIRLAFNHDTDDHLSEFYTGKKWKGTGLGLINPLGKGEGAKIKVSSLSSFLGRDLGYVYDFGSETHHKVTLEKIWETPDPDAHYPLVVDQNKPRYYHCVECADSGRTNTATWICIHCSEEKGMAIYLCEECAEDNHDDHYTEEIVY